MKLGFDLDEMQARKMPKMNWRDVFSTESDEVAKAFDNYFPEFLPYDLENKCWGCRRQFPEALIAMMGGGETRLNWLMQHGEAECAMCLYPYRVFHYITEIKPDIGKLSLHLAYHPDNLMKPEKD